MSTNASAGRRYDCTEPEQRATGMKDAASTVRRGELVVLPTDTVYGIGADAFSPYAVQALLDAKSRGRDMPVPVLVGSVRAASALVEDLTPYGQDLVEEFWPGALTLICRHTTTLNWDIGDTEGTVAVRMPLHQVALELLKETGPMAVSSANRSGAPAATTCDEAEEQLGDAVAVYLDGGRCGSPVPSSIVDLTGPMPRLLREGGLSADRLREVVPGLVTEDDEKQAEKQAEPEGLPAEDAGRTEEHAEQDPEHAEQAEKQAEREGLPAEDAERTEEHAEQDPEHAEQGGEQGGEQGETRDDERQRQPAEQAGQEAARESTGERADG